MQHLAVHAGTVLLSAAWQEHVPQCKQQLSACALQLHKGSEAKYQQKMKDLEELPVLEPVPLLLPPANDGAAISPSAPGANTLHHNQCSTIGLLQPRQGQAEATNPDTSPARKGARFGALPGHSGQVRGLESPFEKAPGTTSLLESGLLPHGLGTPPTNAKPPMPVAPQLGIPRRLRSTQPGQQHGTLSLS